MKYTYIPNFSTTGTSTSQNKNQLQHTPSPTAETHELIALQGKSCSKMKHRDIDLNDSFRILMK